MNSASIEIPETAVKAVTMTRKALSLRVTNPLYYAAQRFYENIGLQMQTRSVDAVVASLPESQKFLPHASSFNLRALNNQALVVELLQEIAVGAAGCEIRKMLSCDQVSCDFDQAWIRRQYAPHNYPSEHAAHSWHQDGALGYDFSQSGEYNLQNPLLPTVTCWIALTQCGVDAPGLEFVTEAVNQLFVPSQLTNESINNRYAADLLWRPRMNVGDAVIFQGGTLHRTHVVEQMHLTRTSVELRFVASNKIPIRLIDDYFVALPNKIE